MACCWRRPSSHPGLARRAAVVQRYGVVIAVGALAAALAVALTVALFRHHRPEADAARGQSSAAIVGATFVIGLQIAAFLVRHAVYFTFLKSPAVSLVPAIESVVCGRAARVAIDRARRRVSGRHPCARRSHRAVLGALLTTTLLPRRRVGLGVMQRRWRQHFRRYRRRALRRKE